MRVFRFILLALAGLLVLLVLLSFLLPATWQVERHVRIKAAPATIYPLIVAPREWRHWSSWNRRDPDMKLSYTGTVRGVGAGWQWESRSQGRGEMVFTEAEPDRLVVYSLHFPDFNSRPSGRLTLEPAGVDTEVSWQIEGDAGYNPVMRWMNLFMDDMVGRDFDEGLANLRTLAESLPPTTVPAVAGP